VLKRTNDLRDEFLRLARSHLGYQCRPGNSSTFGDLTGYRGLPWDGSFIDVVAREAGLRLPSCIYSTSGLAEFIKSRRWRENPQPGDIAFFTFSTGDDFGSPHVGVVSDVTDWSRLGRVRVIEANINSGLPKGSPVNDGVFERTRYNFDILGFGRPDFSRQPAISEDKNADGQPVVHLSNLQPGKRNKDVEKVQLALAKTVSLRNAKQGALDGQTQAAYARWQRSIGLIGSRATGIPDLDSLTRLGRETGIFRVAGQ
jgi:hypothetical protein